VSQNSPPLHSYAKSGNTEVGLKVYRPFCRLAMSLVIAWGRARFPSLPTLALLLPALCLGRILYVAMAWGSARMLTLPARFVAGLSLIAGWPGLLLMALTVPTVVAVITRAARRS